MEPSFDDFRARMRDAVAAQLAGNSEPFLTLWSHRPDIHIFGALGGHEQGWPAIGDRLRWAATKVDARLVRVECLFEAVRGETALTADLEHMIRTVEGGDIERALRVTHGYRVEDGAWRIFYRHGDEWRPSGR